jgi:YrbI family 3-deoxy-D-manno-octulosonate 8-phosphate phosphatase
MKNLKNKIIDKARKIKLLLTDCDGVLTDAGIYYSANGEELKRFSFRDGMGVERLKNLCEVETIIITAETSKIVEKRAEKLKISEIYLGVKDKSFLLDRIIKDKKLEYSEIAYIGDDINDLEAMKKAGLSACPADAMSMIKNFSDYECEQMGGFGAFREFAEIIIYSKTRLKTKKK